jgi:hypothetical protein
MDCTADVLLTFVWDETASGTARSKTYVWLLTVPEAVLCHTTARRRSAVQSINFEENLCLNPCCPRDSLVPYNTDEQISFNPFLLLAVPEAVSSHTKGRSRSAVQSILCLAPRCPRGSLIPYKSKEHQFCGALLTERTLCGGWSGIFYKHLQYSLIHPFPPNLHNTFTPKPEELRG